MRILNNGKKYKLKLTEDVIETKQIKSVTYGELNAVVPDYVETLHIEVAGGGGITRTGTDEDGPYTSVGGNAALVKLDLIGDDLHHIGGSVINASVGNRGNQTTITITVGDDNLIITADCGYSGERHSVLGFINGSLVNNIKNISFSSAENSNKIGWISVDYTYNYAIQKIYKVVI